MQAARNAVVRIDKVRSQIEQALQQTYDNDASGVNGGHADCDGSSSGMTTTVVPQAMHNFAVALADDLSMPRAAVALFALVKAAEGELKRLAKDSSLPLDKTGLAAIRDALGEMDRVFGIFYDVPLTAEDAELEGGNSSGDTGATPAEVWSW
jgi:cysteinyl-tRNA synthetase